MKMFIVVMKMVFETLVFLTALASVLTLMALLSV